MAVSWAAGHLEELRNIWIPGTFINVNIPNSPGGPAGMADTVPARMIYNDKLSVYQAPGGASWCFIEHGIPSAGPEAGTDWEAVSKNLAAVSSVHIHPAGSSGDGEG
jgi:5'-nucleotidase